LFHILIEFAIPMNLVWLIKICPKETYCTVRVAKHLSDMFPHIQRGLKQGDVLSPMLFSFA